MAASRHMASSSSSSIRSHRSCGKDPVISFRTTFSSVSYSLSFPVRIRSSAEADGILRDKAQGPATPASPSCPPHAVYVLPRHIRKIEAMTRSTVGMSKPCPRRLWRESWHTPDLNLFRLLILCFYRVQRVGKMSSSSSR